MKVQGRGDVRQRESSPYREPTTPPLKQPHAAPYSGVRPALPQGNSHLEGELSAETRTHARPPTWKKGRCDDIRTAPNLALHTLTISTKSVALRFARSRFVGRTSLRSRASNEMLVQSTHAGSDLIVINDDRILRFHPRSSRGISTQLPRRRIKREAIAHRRFCGGLRRSLRADAQRHSPQSYPAKRTPALLPSCLHQNAP
jgi:hypothetical protein